VSQFVGRPQQYCTVLLARGVSVFLLLSLLSVIPVWVWCQVPTVLYSTIGERCRCSPFVVATFGNPCLVCCQVPTVLYSTVGKRCLCFSFVVATFGCPCLCLLSGPNSMYSTVGEMCLCFRLYCSYFRLSLFRFVVR
jgi:hypothetical protein